MRDLLRVGVTIGLAVLQVAVPVMGYVGLMGRMAGAEFQTAKTPLVPAGYAFGIWSVIYLACFIYALEQARPSRQRDPRLRRVGWPMAAAMGVNAVWSALAQYEFPLPVLAVVIAVGLAAALVAAVRLFGPEGPEGVDWKVGVAVGLLAGWLTAAAAANLSVALQDLGLGEALGRQAQAVALLSLAGLLAAAIVRATRGALAYAGAVVWALAALVVADLSEGAAQAVAVAAGGWIALLAAAVLAVRLPRSAPPEASPG